MKLQENIKNIQFQILVVEDDAFLSNLLIRNLKESGFDAPLVTDGEEAIEYLKKHNPHLILLDLQIPKKDGFGVLNWIREESDKKNIPVVILSNRNRAEDLEHATKLGAKDYIVKASHSLDEIMQRILKVLQKVYFV